MGAEERGRERTPLMREGDSFSRREGASEHEKASAATDCEARCDEQPFPG